MLYHQEKNLDKKAIIDHFANLSVNANEASNGMTFPKGYVKADIAVIVG